MDNKDIKIETLNDFLIKFQLKDWPNLPDDIKIPELNIESVFGTYDQIYAELENSVLPKEEPFNELQLRVNRIEETISYYKSALLDEGKRFSKIKNNMFYAPTKFFLTESDTIREESDDLNALSVELRKRKRTQSDLGKKRRVENVNYFGFDKNEFSELPNFLEAPQILNLVTNSMSFKPSFLRFWTPIIKSEACNAILLDSFWWFYLHLYKKEEDLEKDKFLYFSRLADSFVTLFLTIDSSLRDKFLNIYADFLSRAIVLTMCKAFPDSILQFNDSFKQEICNIVNEWILGVRPVPESYQNWNLPEDLAQRKVEKATSTVELYQKIGNLEKLLKNLGNDEYVDETLKSSRPSYLNKDSKMSINPLRYSQSPRKSAINLSLENKPQESHVVGEGIVVEKVLFNLKGQSMLISHYLNIHNLQDGEPNGHKMQRTQIKKHPPKTATTYKDLIFETLKRSKSLEAEFKKISAQNALEQKSFKKKERRKAILRLSQDTADVPVNNKNNEQENFEEQSSREFLTKETLQLNKSENNLGESNTESFLV